jgi:hypothetical protein
MNLHDVGRVAKVRKALVSVDGANQDLSNIAAPAGNQKIVIVGLDGQPITPSNEGEITFEDQAGNVIDEDILITGQVVVRQLAIQFPWGEQPGASCTITNGFKGTAYYVVADARVLRLLGLAEA